MNAFAARRERVFEWMERENVSLAVFVDGEKCRNQAIRYLTGQPSDAILFLNSATHGALLAPWDIHLAALRTSEAGPIQIVPYTEWSLDPCKALQAALAEFKTPVGARVELPAGTAYTDFAKYAEAAKGYTLVCRENGAQEAVDSMRAVKDAAEIELYKTASAITDDIASEIITSVHTGAIRTEADAALFIEKNSRKTDCEGPSFATLAAGPERSYAIHAFPGWTNAVFGGTGLSILDFGIFYKGYATDITLPFVRSPLTAAQRDMVNLVEEASHIAFDTIKAGVSAEEPALAVDKFFAKYARKMPHGLGHGIGLEIHEAPFLKVEKGQRWRFEPGMIFTLEPGLYDGALGGCRLENDILLTETGPVRLTNSHLVYL